MESVEQKLTRLLPQTISNAGLMTELATLRDKLKPEMPPSTSIELTELMGIVSVVVRPGGVGEPITRTIKVVAS